MSVMSKFAFRILIVEDLALISDQLRKCLMAALGEETVIDCAKSVEDAIRFFQERVAEGLLPDVGLLDCKLPADKTSNPEVDVMVSQLFQRYEIPIIPYSGDPQNVDVQRQYKKQIGLGENRTALIEKTGSVTWVEEIVARVFDFKPKAISRKVRRGLEDLFGAEGEVNGISVARARSIGGDQIRCGTHELNRLKNAIEQYWPMLDDAVKEAVRRRFAVVDLDGPGEKRLSLFQSGPGAE